MGSSPLVGMGKNEGGKMIIKALVIAGCIIVGLTAAVVLFFLIYSILWMIRERMDEIEGEPGDLEIPWGEDK